MCLGQLYLWTTLGLCTRYEVDKTSVYKFLTSIFCKSKFVRNTILNNNNNNNYDRRVPEKAIGLLTGCVLQNNSEVK